MIGVVHVVLLFLYVDRRTPDDRDTGKLCSLGFDTVLKGFIIIYQSYEVLLSLSNTCKLIIIL